MVQIIFSETFLHVLTLIGGSVNGTYLCLSIQHWFLILRNYGDILICNFNFVKLKKKRKNYLQNISILFLIEEFYWHF